MNLEKTVDLTTSPPIPETKLASITYLFQARGYAALEGFLGAAEIALLRRSMEMELAPHKPHPGIERSALDRHQLHDLMIRDINFAALLEDPRLQDLVAPHLGPHWVLCAATSSSVPPGGTNHAARLHADSPRFRPGYAFNMGIIWTLDAYTPTNGALEVLPGPHYVECPPDPAVFGREAVRVTCLAGSLIIFNAPVFHRTTANQGGDLAPFNADERLPALHEATHRLGPGHPQGDQRPIV